MTKKPQSQPLPLCGATPIPKPLAPLRSNPNPQTPCPSGGVRGFCRSSAGSFPPAHRGKGWDRGRSATSTRRIGGTPVCVVFAGEYEQGWTGLAGCDGSDSLSTRLSVDKLRASSSLAVKNGMAWAVSGLWLSAVLPVPLSLSLGVITAKQLCSRHTPVI